MNRDKIEIEKVENGFEVIVWEKDNDKDEYGYTEPKKYVAKDETEVLALVKENLK